MSQLGEKISIARKAKGLTQEKLADMAGINLRTLQRIEKGKTTPHGDTLNRIATALEIPLEELMNYGAMENTTYIKGMHFSVLTMCFIPLGHILLPLILWMFKKNSVKNLDFFAKKLLNFQLTWTLVFVLPVIFVITGLSSYIGARVTITPWTVIVFWYFGFIGVNVIYTTIVGILIRKEVKNYFPVAIPFIR